MKMVLLWIVGLFTIWVLLGAMIDSILQHARGNDYETMKQHVDCYEDPTPTPTSDITLEENIYIESESGNWLMEEPKSLIFYDFNFSQNKEGDALTICHERNNTCVTLKLFKEE